MRWIFGTFACFAVLNCLASSVNHIDDTDETYGYWEVLHYLLYGHGLQTWEYAPAFAIRTYSFLTPAYLVGLALKVLGTGKLEVFYGIRLILGLFSAFSQAQFVSAFQRTVGAESPVARLMCMFLFFSPGVFFCSTSYLPSALTSSCVALCCAQWLSQRFELAIFWGSLAVLMTGWPFVGIILLPIGIHMLWDRYSMKKQSGLLRLIIQGLLIATMVATFSGAVDVLFYRRFTSPTMNILLYNLKGGGDELYGVEPAGYYIRNLFLNMGIAWPLAIACPVFVLRSLLHARLEVDTQPDSAPNTLISPYLLTLYASALLWLGTLFNRPHKEERFLYPIYPILAVMAAQSAVQLIDMLGGILASILRCRTGDVPSLDVMFSKKPRNQAGQGVSIVAALKHLGLVSCLIVTVSIGFSRIYSNINNYSGYMELWRDLGQALETRHADKPIRVCTGGEWYYFPSHFFLPQHARLEFVRDSFHGQLPQPFRESGWKNWAGTWEEPQQPFNKLNQEEPSRYVDLTTCDFVVALIDQGAWSSFPPSFLLI